MSKQMPIGIALATLVRTTVCQATPVVCWYDGDGDNVCDIEDLYRITQSVIDINGDGIADREDISCVERYLRLNESLSMWSQRISHDTEMPVALSVDTNFTSNRLATWTYPNGDQQITVMVWGGRLPDGTAAYLDEIQIDQAGSNSRVRFDFNGLPTEIYDATSGIDTRVSWIVSNDGSAVGNFVWNDATGNFGTQSVQLPPATIPEIKPGTSWSNTGIALGQGGVYRDIDIRMPDGSPLSLLDGSYQIVDDQGRVLFRRDRLSPVSGVDGRYRVMIPNPCAELIAAREQVQSIKSAADDACLAYEIAAIAATAIAGAISGGAAVAATYPSVQAAIGAVCLSHQTMGIIYGNDGYIDTFVGETQWGNWPQEVRLQVEGLMWVSDGHAIRVDVYDESNIDPCDTDPVDPIDVPAPTFNNPDLPAEDLAVWGVRGNWRLRYQGNEPVGYNFGAIFCYAQRDRVCTFTTGAGASPRRHITASVYRESTGTWIHGYRGGSFQVNGEIPLAGCTGAAIPDSFAQALFLPGERVRLRLSCGNGPTFSLTTPSLPIPQRNIVAE